MDGPRISVIAEERLEKPYGMSIDIQQQIRLWRDEKVALDLKYLSGLESFMGRLLTANEELQKQIVSTQEDIESHRMNAEELSQRVAKLRKENCELKMHQQECALDQRKKEVALRKEGLLSRKSVIASRENIKANVTKYMELLDMEIKKSTDNCLIFIFKHVDEKDPVRCSYFKLTLKDDTYCIPACEPPVNDLNKLVETLNSSNNLQQFVVQMKKRFSQVVSQTQ